MIEATVHEGRDASSHGTFKFEYAPAPGDHLHVGNNRGSITVLRVLYVEHHPVHLPASVNARQDPYISICVEEIDSYGD